MSRRPSTSFIDYLLVAINPALIMCLVGSLVFFLLTVFYRGDFEGRLWFTFAMFVMATVCIARISIEEGRRHAAMFALPMGLVTAFAVNHFTNLSVIFNFSLLGMVWWSTDRLTWDCTVIDDEQDSTGSGLLQVLGWEAEGTHNAGEAAEDAPARGFLEKWFPSRGTRHTPGVWVIYFSLAALPLFGMGQWFMPTADTAARGTAFMLLVAYMGSGMALLMTTTFLGLRRYLRQRGVEMPVEMAVTWLTVGIAMIGALLLLAMLLPRPTGHWQLPQFVSASNRDSSWFGRGKEAAQGDQSGKQSGQPRDPGSPSVEPSKDSPSANTNPPKDAKDPAANGSAGNTTKQSKSAADSSSKNGSSQNSANATKSSDNAGNNQPQSNTVTKNKPSSNSQDQPPPKPESESQLDSEPSPKNESNSKPPNDTNQSQPQNSGNENAPTPPPSEPPPPQAETTPPPSPSESVFAKIAEILATLGRLLSYVVLAAIIFFFAWKYREQWLAVWRQLWQEWTDFLARLFGRREKPQAPISPSLPPPTLFPTFASFPDPFHSGIAQRTSPADLVVYSFRAFEAWARERGCPRTAEQTPLEFAQTVATKQTSVTREARELAELYCQVAYARAAIPGDSVQKLSRLWRGMMTSA